jgi:hypothetical protein
VDGQYFDEVSVAGVEGDTPHTLRGIFCTTRLLPLLCEPDAIELYIWNRHVYAIKNASGLTEDLEGVRASFLYRDRYLLVLLAASVVMLPYAIYVLARKLSAIGSLPKLRNGRVDAAA